MRIFDHDYYRWQKNIINIIAVLMLQQLLFGCTPTTPAGPKIPPVDSAETSETQPQKPLLPALHKVEWQNLTAWQTDDPRKALQAFRASCQVVKKRPGWQDVCTMADTVTLDKQAVRRFFQDNFTPWQVINEDGSPDGLITGYYVPDLDGSRESSSRFPYPIYRKPDDMLVIDLASIYPELAKYRLRGRVQDGRVVPYRSRAEIDGFKQPLHGQELFWVDDPVKLFFLQIQGSGRINLDDGTQVMIGYADQNGHPYRSIGKLLLQRGAMVRSQMSMQNIAKWGREHPLEVQQLLNENPSYVFFRILPNGEQNPPGALGIPLTPQRSIAVDRRTVPLGSPVFLTTTWPHSSRLLNRLMIAQDTGGAIKGRVRADFFWGVGDKAGSYAGRMKQTGQMWVLLPNGIKP